VAWKEVKHLSTKEIDEQINKRPTLHKYFRIADGEFYLIKGG